MSDVHALVMEMAECMQVISTTHLRASRKALLSTAFAGLVSYRRHHMCEAQPFAYAS